MSAPHVTYVAPRPPRRAWAPGYQRVLSVAFLVAVVLMCSQYTLYRYGPATVVVSPIGRAAESEISYYAQPKEGVPDSDIQQPGLYLLNWATYDQVAYRLHTTRSIPPAELLIALLFLAALPLVGWFGRALPWPRAPQWLLLGLAAMALVGSTNWSEGIKELIQWGLIMAATWWLAAAALVDAAQVRRLGRLLLWITGVLAVLALGDWVQWVARAEPAQPLLVRASLQSRSAYGGLMAMLLVVATAYALATPIAWRRWTALAGIWLTTLTLLSGGALIAAYVGCLLVAARRSPRVLLCAAVAAPLGWALLLGIVQRDQFRLVHESISFYRYEQGQRVGVEKRYLEMGAALNILNGTGDQVETRLVPSEVPGEEPQRVPVGQRSALTHGLGLGLAYQEAIGRHYNSLDNPEKQEPDTYTLYLLLAAQLGLFGAIAWAWLLADGAKMAGRAEVRRAADSELAALASGLRGAFVALAFFSIWGTLLLRGTGPLVFVLLAAAWRLEGLRTEVEEASSDGSRREDGDDYAIALDLDDSHFGGDRPGPDPAV